MQPLQTFQVPAQATPIRLDQFLIKHFPTTTRNFWRKNLTQSVRVNGRVPKKGLFLNGGEKIELLLLPPEGPFVVLPDASLNIPILYKDEDVIAVNKPPGLTCHPLKRDETGTLANAMVAQFPELAKVGAEREAGLIHRLDNDTSGVVLFARHPESYHRLAADNRNEKITKYYLACVEGNLTGHGTWRESIAHHPKNPQKMRAVNQEKSSKERVRTALTEYRVIRQYRDFTLLLLRLYRGQRHQIRVHCAHHLHPILGDRLYGSATEIPHHLLHARKVNFIHPRHLKKMSITAPLPLLFSQKISSLET